MSGRPEIAIIVARARNGVIGRDNALPWRLREDLQQFKQRTLGHPIIMGRKTWESLGQPLPGRTNVVVSRQAGYRAEGAIAVASIEAAIAACGNANTVFIIGGAQIYSQSLAQADVFWITEVAAEVAGDAHFPTLPLGFHEVSRQHFEANERNDYAFDIIEYRGQETA